MKNYSKHFTYFQDVKKEVGPAQNLLEAWLICIQSMVMKGITSVTARDRDSPNILRFLAIGQFLAHTLAKAGFRGKDGGWTKLFSNFLMTRCDVTS